MVFRRDVPEGTARMEFSWVPEGNRLPIEVLAPRDENSRMDPVSDDITQVQVYRLDIGDFGTVDWQFPPGPPHSFPVISAVVQTFLRRGVAIGTVHYADGTSATDTRQLGKIPPAS
jgi:hypothetical protein